MKTTKKPKVIVGGWGGIEKCEDCGELEVLNCCEKSIET